MDTHLIPEELREFIAGEAETSGYRIVDISAKGGTAARLEVILDKEGGITLDECGEFNRRVMSWIDEHDVFAGGCTLDVCSPGLDRELRSDNDFSWATGKEVVINVHEPVNGKMSIEGRLTGTGDKGEVMVEEGPGNIVRIEKKNVARAKLVVKL
jgi:ribosome maturation factor RimP